MRAFSATAWRSLMLRLGVARGAVMVRGAEVLRWRTGDAACTVDLAPDLAHQRDWSGRAGPTGSTGTTRPSEASAARCTPAISPASAADRGRQRGRRSRPHQLDLRRGAAASGDLHLRVS